MFNIKANLTSIILTLSSSNLTQSVCIPFNGRSCSYHLFLSYVLFVRLCQLHVFVMFVCLCLLYV